MRLILKNNFHDTQVTILAAAHVAGDVIEITPSKRQLARIHRTLCGIEGCTCGGIRGAQFDVHGFRIIVDSSNALR